MFDICAIACYYIYDMFDICAMSCKGQPPTLAARRRVTELGSTLNSNPVYTDGYYTKSTRAHMQKELIRGGV